MIRESTAYSCHFQKAISSPGSAEASGKTKGEFGGAVCTRVAALVFAGDEGHAQPENGRGQNPWFGHTRAWNDGPARSNDETRVDKALHEGLKGCVHAH